MRSVVSVCVTTMTCHEFVLFSSHGLSRIFTFALGTGSSVRKFAVRVTHVSVCFPRGVNVYLNTRVFSNTFHVFNFYHAINSYKNETLIRRSAFHRELSKDLDRSLVLFFTGRRAVIS